MHSATEAGALWLAAGGLRRRSTIDRHRSDVPKRALTVATLLTIFFVPALYAAWFRVERAAASNPPMPSTAAAAA